MRQALDPGWAGHAAGGHVNVGLVAADHGCSH
jgi:hypothetical protein